MSPTSVSGPSFASPRRPRDPTGLRANPAPANDPERASIRASCEPRCKTPQAPCRRKPHPHSRFERAAHRTAPTSPTDPLKTPRIPGDPRPLDPDLSKPTVARPDLTPEQYQPVRGDPIQPRQDVRPRGCPDGRGVAGGYPRQ